ncbi:MAG: TetR/AcrR family transcriptional regulator [Proteobacteria bacterium]|nr:TetR/AcrR family transcriptional regulator [Pseudomonadota bacterium]
MAIRRTGEERRGEIVAAAIRLADKYGPDRLTADAIAREVGLTQPGVFRHFPKKRDIWEAVVTAIGDGLRRRWAAALAAHDAPDERLAALFRAQLEQIRATPALPAILFSRGIAAQSKALRAVFLSLLADFHRLLAGTIAAGRTAGVFRKDLDDGTAAYAVVGLVQGLAVRWTLTNRQFDLLGEGERMLGVLLFGLLAAPPARRNGEAK